VSPAAPPRASRRARTPRPPRLLRPVPHPPLSRSVSGPAEAIARLRAGDAPLTAYVFSPRREVEERFAAETSSGSLALGLTLAHVGSVGVPFGGVGVFRMGACRGPTGYEPFTHEKPGAG